MKPHHRIPRTSPTYDRSSLAAPMSAARWTGVGRIGAKAATGEEAHTKGIPVRKYVEIVIALAFLGYGLIRLGVGSALLGQEVGLIDVQAFREPIADIGEFLRKSSGRQIIGVSVAGYVGYIALMGVVLSIGALRTLKNGTSGLYFIGTFIAMYALLFVNFQTINPKVIHLGVSAVLFAVLLWLKGGRSRMSESHA